MVTLDVLDYQLALDEALDAPDGSGRPLLEAALRRQAIKDARRLLDAMAFRFALMDDRALPEDHDYERALDAMKPAPAAAPVLARRRPIYAAVRRRRRITTWSTLAVIALLIGGGAYLITSEETTSLSNVVAATPRDLGLEGATLSVNETFYVEPAVNRLHLDGNVFVVRGSPGIIEVRLVDPSGKVAYYDTVSASDTPYLRHNIVDPAPGVWRIIVDFLSVEGSANIGVDGVRPTR